MRLIIRALFCWITFLTPLLCAQNDSRQAEAAAAGLEIIPRLPKELDTIRQRAQTAFYTAKFDDLETLLSEARNSGDADELAFAYMGTKPQEKTQSACELEIRQALKWKEQKPGSVPARVALSSAFISHAWVLRGDGYANTVKPEVKPLMANDFRAALETLSEVNSQRVGYPEWYDEVLAVFRAIGQNRESYDAIFAEGTKRFPTYWSLYLEKATYLMERWYGRPGDWQAFLKQSADSLGGENGDILYARIYWNMRTYDIYYDDPLTRTGLDYTRIKRGYEATIRRHPGDYSKCSHFFQIARDAGDQVTMRAMMSMLGNRIDFGVWKSVKEYNQDKKGLISLTRMAGP